MRNISFILNSKKTLPTEVGVESWQCIVRVIDTYFLVHMYQIKFQSMF